MLSGEGKMEKSLRKEILARYKPKRMWRGEPWLGSWYTEEEIEVVVKTIRESMDWEGDGFGFICKEIAGFEQAFAGYCGTKECISINGAGTGLDMAMMALNLKPGDEVIVPAINFKASTLAVIGQRGKVIFCEVDPRTFCADPNDVEKRMTKRTRAIFPTHMNGLSCDMDALLEIAERHPHPKYGPPKVIGDAARACGGEYKGTKIGKKGWMNIFSFHTQKNMTTLGEGGAITTDDLEVAKILRSYRQFGNVADTWGSNYKMTKVQAAVGLVQLKKLDKMIEMRRKVAKERTELLKDIPELTLPYEPPGYKHTYYLYTILVPKKWAGEKRDKLMKILAEEYNVGCVVANPPVYEIPFIRRHTGNQKLPLSDELGKRIFCPPIHPCMTKEQNQYICAAIIEAVEKIREEGIK